MGCCAITLGLHMKRENQTRKLVQSPTLGRPAPVVLCLQLYTTKLTRRVHDECMSFFLDLFFINPAFFRRFKSHV